MWRWLRSVWEWEAEAARERILAGNAPLAMRVRGVLEFAELTQTVWLPYGLQADVIRLIDCPAPIRLPAGLSCRQLVLRRSNIASLPVDLRVAELVDAAHCRNLAATGPLILDRLDLHGCVQLQSLPDGMSVRSLNLSGCYRLTAIPHSTAQRLTSLIVGDCALLTELPSGLTELERLDLRGCRSLTSLPDDIRIRSWIDVAGCGLTFLPWSLRSVRIRWNGIEVSDRIAFAPESITVDEILHEPNAAVRRVLLERVGMEWFLDHCHAHVIDQDQDAGGTRRLLSVPFDGDEDYAFVEVFCPSTAHRYILRVPPHIRSCQAAVAWTAGFSSPNAYRPVAET